jgi:hypothetical protein
MATPFIPSVSTDRLQETLFDICLLGPRWQGSEGEAKVRAYIERTLKQSEVIYKREEFEYLAFEPGLADLVIKGSSQRKIDCEVLAYSVRGGRSRDGLPLEKNLSSVRREDRSNGCLKSYQSVSRAAENGAWGFI